MTIFHVVTGIGIAAVVLMAYGMGWVDGRDSMRLEQRKRSLTK